MTRGLLLIAGALMSAGPAPAAEVSFARDVRPLLSDACFNCHGPDAKKRKADLRLDTEEGVRAVLSSGARAFEPGKPHQSEAYQRLLATGRRRMPPLRSNRQLSRSEIDLIRRWVEQGARWQGHWAFLAPKRPATPAVKGAVDNPIDAFILTRLEAAGLGFSPPAEAATLLRRATLDLTGLPPTPEEVDALESDPRPGAYERAVDRLLASPRLGERLAVRWLDAARYADTSGYQSDGERVMWRWRDGVIEAFNANQPFDQFTVEQVAGDLLPGATLEQKVASGFNRNHRGNAEGGIIPEEYAAEYVADRVETTATVWLGLTMTCARCHDHKYDPVTTKEFYRLFAFFNQVPERGKAVKYGNSPPLLLSPTRFQKEQLAALDRNLARARRAVSRLQPQLLRQMQDWEESNPKLKPRPQLPDEQAVSERAGDFGFYDRFTLAAWVSSKKPDGVIVARATHVPEGEGYSVRLYKGRLQVNLVKRWLDDAIRVETEAPFPLGTPHHVVVRYDGSRWASGIGVFIDGKPVKLRVLLDELNQTFQNKEPFRTGNAPGANNAFVGRIHDVRVFARDLKDEEISEVATAESEADILKIAPGKRTPGQRRKLQRQFVAHHACQSIQDAYGLVNRLEHERQRLLDRIPTTMVMADTPRPRDTFVLLRGQYDRPGEKVTPGVPGVLPPWPAGEKLNRLGLARWLVAPDNPLTARVMVNRLWQMLFGAGLVRTVEDFGVQGEAPTHPELLDWLAVEFRESGWDVKRLLRLMVLSRTYQQSSRLTAKLRQIDPENRLLGRSSRLRLSAEMIRDQALAASGLLVERLGGPSVRPYQPGGLWQELADTEYVRDRGPDLYRRGLYTFWKRTVAPPGLVAFDAAGRETCSVRESRTNTPLQALNLLNDVTYVEAARVLASRVMLATRSPTSRLRLAFRLVLARSPGAQELPVLEAALARQRDRYKKDPQAARKLVRQGDSPPNARLDEAELAAYTAVASVILNLDESVNRE